MNQPDLPKSRLARVSHPHRTQTAYEMVCLDELLPLDHQARLVWRFVQTINTEPFYANIVVSASVAGRTAISPELLIALWLLATMEGIGSARELERRCERDIAYRWLCGGITVNYHTLSDFRVKHGVLLEQLLVNTVASLIHQKLVPLEILAQDGMRVRASAGKSSFRRKSKLKQLRDLSQAHVNRLKEEGESESLRLENQARKEAAQRRAAQEKLERLDEAIRQIQEQEEDREKRKKGSGVQTRASMTDPEARKMKMANGGFDPAYNVQFATDADSRVIVGVTVCNEGTDGGQLMPMLDKMEKQYAKKPNKVLADSAYATKDAVTRADQAGVEVVSSVPRVDQLARNGKDAYTRQKGDTEEYVRYRQRMSKPEYQKLYMKRPSVAEFPNAVCRNRKLYQFGVRGLAKVTAAALWHALAFNLTRMASLKAIA